MYDYIIFRNCDRKGNIVFTSNGMAMAEFCKNGDIYVKGNFVEKDLSVVDGIRSFILKMTDNGN